MNNILLLCVGNICRSPIAEALFKQQFPDKKVWSAGLAALVGSAADDAAIKVAADHGFDLSKHRAQQVFAWMCQDADLILVMEKIHKSELERNFPAVKGKVFGLGDVSKFQIADPYRGPTTAFEKAYLNIARGVADWAPRIRQLDSVG